MKLSALFPHVYQCVYFTWPILCVFGTGCFCVHLGVSCLYRMRLWECVSLL